MFFTLDQNRFVFYSVVSSGNYKKIKGDEFIRKREKTGGKWTRHLKESDSELKSYRSLIDVIVTTGRTVVE